MVVSIKKYQGVTLLELLVAIFISSLVLELFYKAYSNHQQIEKYIYLNHQAVINLNKVSSHLKEDFKLIKQSKELLAARKMVNLKYPQLINRLQRGFNVSDDEVNLYYLSKQSLQPINANSKGDELLFNSTSFKVGDYLLVYNQRQAQVIQVAEVHNDNNNQWIKLLDKCILDEDFYVKKISKLSLSVKDKGVYLSHNNQNKLLFANHIHVTKMRFINQYHSRYYIENDFNTDSIGIIINWSFKLNQFNRNINQWLI